MSSSAPAGSAPLAITPGIPLSKGPDAKDALREERKDLAKADKKQEVQRAENEINQSVTSRDTTLAKQAVTSLHLKDAEKAALETLLPTLIAPDAPDAAPTHEMRPEVLASPESPSDAPDVAPDQRIEHEPPAEGARTDARQADGSAAQEQAILRGDKPLFDPKSESVLNRTLASHVKEPAAQKAFSQALSQLNSPNPQQRSPAVQHIAQTLKNIPLAERAAAHAEIFALVKCLKSVPKNHPNYPVVQKALQQAQVLAKILGPRTEAELPVYAQKTREAAQEGTGKALVAQGRTQKPEEKAPDKVRIFACTDAAQAEEGACEDYTHLVTQGKSLEQLASTHVAQGGKTPELPQPQLNQQGTVFIAQGPGHPASGGDHDAAGRESRGKWKLTKDDVDGGKAVAVTKSRLPEGGFYRERGSRMA